MGITKIEFQEKLVEELKSLDRGYYEAYFEDDYGFTWSMYLKGMLKADKESEIVQLNMVPCDKYGRVAYLDEIIRVIEGSNGRGYLNSYKLEIPDVEIDKGDTIYKYYKSELFYIESYQISSKDYYIEFKLKSGCDQGGRK